MIYINIDLFHWSTSWGAWPYGKVFPKRYVITVPACLADEELSLEEDSVEESRRRAEDEQRRALLEVQRREEEKRATEERV
jgi:hypothetical protein